MVKYQQKSITRHHHGRQFFPLIVLIALSQVCLTAVFPLPLLAETQYVIPSAEIPVRRGQGTDYKIVALVSDGAEVEVLERGESYSLVRLANEKEGWILTRFLSDDPPLTDVVAALTSENEALKLQQQQSSLKLDEQEQQSSRRLEDLDQALSETKRQLETAIAEKEAIAASFEKLQKDTANVVEIKQNLANTLKENRSIKQTLATLTRENEELKSDDRINWFLTGAGVLLLGIIIGKITNRSRKRKPSLL